SPARRIPPSQLRASVGSTEVTVCLRSSTLITPCARAPRRYAAAKNFPIGIALVELGHRLINQRGPEVVRCGRQPSVSPAFRVGRGIRASGEGPTIPQGNGAGGSAWFDGPRNHGQRVFSREPAM